MIEITLRRSAIATTPNQRENLRGLGLFRREQKVRRADTPSLRGMIRKVLHLVEVRKVSGSETKATVSRFPLGVEVVPGEAGAQAPKAKTVEAAALKAREPRKARSKKTAGAKKTTAARKKEKES